VMLGAPGLVDQKQLDELLLDLREVKEWWHSTWHYKIYKE
jgi:hypothetical protein